MGFNRNKSDQDPMIGKCYKYKNNITDPDEIYLKILIKKKTFFGTYSGMEIKSFGMFGTKDQPSIFWENISDDKLKLMTEITSDEFDLKTNPIIDIFGLQKIPDDSSSTASSNELEK